MNTAPPAPPSNPANPNEAAAPAPLNAAAQRRPSDRGFPTGPGFPQPPGAFNPGNGTNPFGVNPANFNPDDPSTWPPITLAPPAAQPAPGQGQPQSGIAPRPGQPGIFQPSAPGALGQLAGQGGLNPQPPALTNPNPLAQSGLTALVPDPSAVQNSAVQNSGVQNNGVPNPNQFPIAPDPQPVQQPQPQPQQLFGGTPPFNASQLGNLTNAGFDPQNPNPRQPVAPTGQPNPLPGGPTNNPALNAIDNALFRPNQAPTTGPTGSPGIAGVASTFKGPSIKAYKERSKYQEWEFIYEPAVNQPGTNQPAANPLGQNTAAPAPGQTPAQGTNNPFSPTTMFGPPAPAK